MMVCVVITTPWYGCAGRQLFVSTQGRRRYAVIGRSHDLVLRPRRWLQYRLVRARHTRYHRRARVYARTHVMYVKDCKLTKQALERVRIRVLLLRRLDRLDGNLVPT